MLVARAPTRMLDRQVPDPVTGSPFASARRAPTRVWRRTVRLVAALVVVVAITWAAVIGALWVYAWFQLGGLDLRATDGEDESLGSVGAQAPDGATTVLVALTEPRDPTVPGEPELAGPVAIVQFGGGREVPAVLLLPTELPVSVEGLGTAPLDEVHLEGGEDLLARAVIDYAEVRIDHVVSLTVDALPGLVDVLGEVERCTTTTCTPTSAQEVREIQELEDPNELVAELSTVVRGIGTAMDTGSTIRSPLKAKRAIDVVADEIRTDVSLRGTVLLDLAETFADIGRLEVDDIPLFRNPNSGELVPLEEPVMVRFERLRDGSSLADAVEEDDVEAMVTEMVEVAVLNGAGTAGLAAEIQARLQAAGFVVTGTGNAPTFDRPRTVVSYGPEPVTTEVAAVVLAEQLGGAQLEALDQPPLFEGEPVDILVVVGEDLDTDSE
jgi:hypothetical protein